MSKLAEQIRARLNTKAGKEIAISLKEGEKLLQIKNWIPLKPFFKRCSGGGEGFPCGHITQIIGKPDSGKSTLIMEGMVSCQKAGGVVFLIDAEHKFDFNRFELMGGTREDVIVIKVNSLEEAWEGINHICQMATEMRAEGFAGLMMMCWDSVAASVPQKILDDEAGDAHMALEAKLNNKNVRKLRQVIKDIDLACVFINHYYMTNPKTKYEQPELIIKGGEEITFFSTLIIKTKQGAKIKRTVKEVEQKIGRVTRFEVLKGHFSGRSVVEDVYVVDIGILETDEDLTAYKKTIRGEL